MGKSTKIIFHFEKKNFAYIYFCVTFRGKTMTPNDIESITEEVILME